MQPLLFAIPIGIGATAIVDLWSIARWRLFGVAPPEYGHLGRWIGHMPHGHFRHPSIKTAATIAHERLIGWTAHYLIGIAFAALLLLLRGEPWLRNPTLGPALLFGLVSVAAPWLLMQPGMGAGIAARSSPAPGAVRRQSLLTHAIFGVGLYAAAWAVSAVRAT